MCGITGILYFDQRAVDPDLLKTMADRIAHRGPDGEGYYIEQCVGLGHRRLAIIDISANGKQPMPNEDGSIWITYNGEIYNFPQLRHILEQKGHQFRSNTDTEVVIHAYEEWGTECLERLNGMFAFAIWDSRKKQFFLARDRAGIKPLFYHCTNKIFAFGSEIKAILPALQTQSNIDYQALSYFLALNYVPAPHTLFASVRQLMPGEFMLVTAAGDVKVKQYWELRYKETDYKDESFYKEQLEFLIEDAVSKQLVSDVPFGVFLSGGLDSSTVAYWMRKHIDNSLKTFSIGFPEESYNELKYAEIAAKHLAVDHYTRVIDAKLVQLLPEMVWHAEEPTADSSMVAVYYLAKLAKKHVKMVLSGDGADEIFAGYDTYRAYYIHRLYRLLPQFIRTKCLAPLVESLPVSEKKISWDFKFRRFVNSGSMNSESAHAIWRMIFDSKARRKLLSPISGMPGVDADVIDLYGSYFSMTNAKKPLNRMLYVDTRLYLPNDMLVKVDRMSMAHGLEVRVPFLDHRLIDLAATIPPKFKLKNCMRTKYLLKSVMRNRLPSTIINRKKEGFNVPKTLWIKKDLKHFLLEHLSPNRLQSMGFIEPAEVGKLLDDHFKQKADNSFQLWNLLTLSIWWGQFMSASGYRA